MEKMLIDFISFVRSSGLGVTTSEQLDCSQALLMIPLFNRSHFYYTLRTTLVKSHIHYELFEQLFNSFFSNQENDSFGKIEKDSLAVKSTDFTFLKEDPFKLETSPKGRKKNNRLYKRSKSNKRINPERTKIDRIFTSQRSYRLKHEELLKSLFGDSKEDIKRLAEYHVSNWIVSQEKKTSSSQMHESNSSNQTKNASLTKKDRKTNYFDWSRINLELSQILHLIIEQIKDPLIVEKLTKSVIERLDYYKKMAFFMINFKSKRKPIIVSKTKQYLMDVPFKSLQSFKFKEMQEIIQRLAFRLASRSSLRNQAISKGQIDIKHTLRSSLRYGGHPIDLKFRKKRLTRPEIFVLCDISGSVKQTVQFFLFFLSQLMFSFSKVRSFVFVSLLDELKNNSFNLEIDDYKKLIKNTTVDHRGYSDFGYAFSEFHHKFGQALSHRTVLIIIGDARNNHKPSRVDLLQLWRKKVRKIIWLNPEPRSKWNQGDSIMNLYSNYCTQVFECLNLQQLSMIVSTIIKT